MGPILGPQQYSSECSAVKAESYEQSSGVVRERAALSRRNRFRELSREAREYP